MINRKKNESLVHPQGFDDYIIKVKMRNTDNIIQKMIP